MLLKLLSPSEIYDLTEDIVSKITRVYPELFKNIDYLNIKIGKGKSSRAVVRYNSNNTYYASITITVKAPHVCRCMPNNVCVYEYKTVISRIQQKFYSKCYDLYELPVGAVKCAYIYHILHELAHIAEFSVSFDEGHITSGHGPRFSRFLMMFIKYLNGTNYDDIKECFFVKYLK